jgi:hypothetical protein
VGDDSLIGVLTVAPPVSEHGTSWFGIPARSSCPRDPMPRTRRARHIPIVGSC